MPQAQTLAQKLQIKLNSACLILNAPPGYETIELLPAGCTIDHLAGAQYDMVLLYVHNIAESARHLQTAINALKAGTLFWIAYPKKTGAIETDMSRDQGWDTVQALGYEPVRQVAIDDTWSALRFRLSTEIKRKPIS